MTFYRSTVLLGAAISLTAFPLRGQASADSTVIPASGSGATPLPGDQITLRIWNEPTISGTYSIQENGEVVLPKFGPLRVVDRTIGSLQDSLRAEYSDYLINPSIEVIVLRRIRVLGEVENPGIFMADLTMKLPELIAAAGGITEAGNPENVVVIRAGQEVRYRSRATYEFLTAELRSGDQVIVKRRSALARNPLGTTTAAMGALLTLVTVLVPAVKALFE